MNALGSALCLLGGIAVASGCHKSVVHHGEVSPDAIASANETAQKNENDPPLEGDDYWEHTKTVFNVPVGNSPVLGNPNALVTIVEFADFQCLPCSGIEPTLKALRGKYGDRIRMVWKNDPPAFHPAAEPAAEAALEVRAERGAEGFWNVHDRLFERQEALIAGNTPNTDAIVKIAGEAGGNPDKVEKAIARRTHEEEIGADVDLGEDLENKGTLHFFINGRRLDGAQPRERFERMIDEELEKAQNALARGVPLNELYETLIKNGRGPWPTEVKQVPKSLPTNTPSMGSPTAKVTIHVWSDYQCALCVAAERTMSELRKDFGDRIKFVWHDLPLPRHADAQMVAQAGREAYVQKGSGGFWAVHDKIMSHPRRVTRADLDAFAKDLHLDMNRWKVALDGGTHSREIEADEKAAADDGITETPAYLVVPLASSQGYFVDAMQELSKLRRIVERAIEEAGK
jgi:protein-disulfide isomerase